MKNVFKKAAAIACSVAVSAVFSVNVMACTVGNPVAPHNIVNSTGNTGEQYVSAYSHQYVEKIVNGVNFYASCTISCFNKTRELRCSCGTYTSWEVTGTIEKHSKYHT